MEQPKDPQKELEIAISELEERVDRLRSLYEQYFMGYEKVEPTVQRKDVDRRFANLRKQQIRNTAIRFRFTVVTQRFNTYAMYWTRICRQIEEGTYKRHVARAERRFNERDRPGADRLADASIDVDLGDFEDLDVDQVLAEADEAAAAYSRRDDAEPADTDPPQAEPSGRRAALFSEPPAELAAAVLRTRPAVVPKAAPLPQIPPAKAAPLVRPTPTAPMTPVSPTGHADDDPDREVESDPAPRTPRHVALPPGARAVMLRRRDGEPPASSREVPMASPRAESVRHPPPPGPAPPPSAPAVTTPRSPVEGATPGVRQPLVRPGTAPFAMPVSKVPAIRPAAAPAPGPPLMPTPAVPFRPAPPPAQRPAPAPVTGPEPASQHGPAPTPSRGGSKGAPTPISPISPRAPGPGPRPPESRPGRPAPGLPSGAPGMPPKKP